MYLALLLLWFALCAEQDARQRQIANWLTFGGAAIALACLLISGHTLVGAPAAEGGWAFVLAVLFTLPGYALGRLGAGDVSCWPHWAWQPIVSIYSAPLSALA